MNSVHEAIDRCFGLTALTIEDAGKGQGQAARYRVAVEERRFIAKHYGPSSRKELEWVRFECALLAWLRDSGTPVAGVIKTLDGQPFTLLEDRPLLMFEWIEGGVEWPTSPAKAARLGAALAEMHVASDGLPLSGSERLYDLDRLVDRPLRLLEPFSDGNLDELRRLVQPFRERIAAVPIEQSTFGPIHGDIHQGNCVFGEDGGLGVIDFALCGVGYRAYDLTGFLWPMRDATIEDQSIRECCEAFLAGYRRVRPISPEEEAAIPAFVQIRSLWETGDWIDTGTGRDQPDDVRKAIPYLIEQFAC